jgi:hypothetical protein
MRAKLAEEKPGQTLQAAALVDIHGVHREQRPGSGPEGMQLLRLAGFHNFGAPCIPFDVFVPRPTEATGLLVSSAGAYTHQAYAAFPRTETGRLLQGHACAVAVYHALTDGVPVHEVDVCKVQLTGLEHYAVSFFYYLARRNLSHWLPVLGQFSFALLPTPAKSFSVCTTGFSSALRPSLLRTMTLLDGLSAALKPSPQANSTTSL